MTRPDFERTSPVPPGRPPLLQPVPWRRLRPAPPAQVEAPTGQPVSVQCAVVAGRLKVRVGPWRASGHWWESADAWAREDWEVEAASGTAVRLSRSAVGWRATDVLD